jgi:hypothetical protein
MKLTDEQMKAIWETLYTKDWATAFQEAFDLGVEYGRAHADPAIAERKEEK